MEDLVEDNIIIIPSLNPNNKLIKIVNELKKNHFTKIIVVDDGSNSQKIFNELKEVTILHHPHNLGKGAAIKTAVSNASKYYSNIGGYIFMDSDGQHTINDVKKIDKALKDTKQITLGVRDFNALNVPKRSKMGNKFSAFYFKLITGKTLEDTQTGLRGIPQKYTSLLLKTNGDRYEYEMNFLIYIASHNIPFKQIKITTVYEDNNKESHFHPVKDSIRIYKEPLKFMISSITSFIIDISLFAIFHKITSYVFLASILARIISGIYNYNINKYWCFKESGKHDFLKYLCLFIIQMLISSSLIKGLSLLTSNLIIFKIIIDTILFILSYIIQKKYIFKERIYES
jgi:putative flippase GtrA